MALPNIFSRRRRAAEGAASDIYIYDKIPNKVRVQIVHLIMDGLGRHDRYSNNASWWAMLLKTMRREKGVFHLTNGYEDASQEYCNWLLSEEDIPLFLDGVELSFRAIKGLKEREYQGEAYTVIEDELNARLLEATVGYQLRSGNIVQLDHELVHKEIVLPALRLLSERRFAGANDEYLGAHEFYRNGDFESCLIECGKAFESVLKVIGDTREWGLPSNATASRLVGAAFDSGFIPAYMQGQFTALRSVLEAGIPVIRNRMSGHGAGGQVRQVDRHLAGYQLHQTAAAIVFLVEHDRLTP